MKFFFFLVWWFLLYGSFSWAWTRPFDDCKNFLLYLGIGLFLLIRDWRRPGPVLFLTLPNIFLAGYLLPLILFLGKPYYHGAVSLVSLLLWIFFVVELIRLPLEKKIRLIQWAVIGASFVVLLNILHLAGFLHWRHFEKFIFPIGNAIYYGDFMALHLPWAVFLFWRGRGIERLLWGSLFSLLLYGLWISGTRASLLGVVIALTVCVVLVGLKRSVGWWKLAAVTAGFFALLFLYYKISPGGHRLQSFGSRIQEVLVLPWTYDFNNASAGRWLTYKKTFQVIRERPWTGWGIGSFTYVYPEFNGRPGESDPIINMMGVLDHPMNELLHQWATGGLFALLLFILWWGAVGFQAVRKWFSNSGESNEMLVASLAGLVIALVSWQLSPNFTFPLSRLLVSLHLALIWPFLGWKSWGKIPLSPKKVWLGLIFILTLFVGSYYFSLYAANRGSLARTPEQRRDWVFWGMRLAPGSFEPSFRYVSMHLWGRKPQNAWPVLERMRNQFPYLPIVLYQTAVMRHQQGRSDEALLLMEKAVQNSLGDPEAKRWVDSLKGQRP